MNDRYGTRNVVPDFDEQARGLANLPIALSQMGWTGLRRGQREVIYHLIACQDVFAILSTSVGKTGTYVISTLCMGWKTIVFSPLQALIVDQAEALQAKGIRAAGITASQPDAMNNQALRDWTAGNLDIMLVSPERTKNEAWLQAMEMVKPDMVALDECHCMSDWGENFRPSYKFAGDWVAKTQPRVVLAMTATATHQVEKDVRQIMGIGNAERILFRPRRNNLKLFSDRAFFNDKDNKNMSPSPGDKEEPEFLQFVADKMSKYPGESGIVYCNTVQTVESTAQKLNDHYLVDQVTFYHGQMPDRLKKDNQRAWMTGEKPLIVCTNAFGMGIDKGDVRLVIHRDMPKTPEEIDQQNGRAGRDERDSECHMFFSESAIRTLRFFLRASYPREDTVRKVYDHLKMLGQQSPGGLIYKTNDEIINRTKVDRFAMQSIMLYLHGERMIEEAKDCIGPPRVRFQESYNSLKPIYIKILQAIQKLGVDKEDRWIEFSFESVADELRKNPSTLRNNLKTMHNDKLIEFCPPPPRPPRRVIGDFDSVSHEKLDYKADMAAQKLEEVIEYCHTDDSLKHNFLERCLIT